MSKMSQLHAELSEQATDLGYETLEQALNDGWCVDYDESRLYKRIDIQEEAHAEWLKEKEIVLNDLRALLTKFVALANAGSKEAVHEEYIIEHAIEFIEKGEV